MVGYCLWKKTTGFKKSIEAMKPKRILMAVSSSGGHILPAVAVAEAVKELSSEAQVYFVHSGGPTGKKIFSNFSCSVYEIPLGGLAQGQSLKTRLKTLFQLPLALVRAWLLIKKLKVEVVFGTGGAITGPVLLTARFMGLPTALWEGNAVCGLANRLLLPFVSVAFTVFENVSFVSGKKQIHSGYPLRKSFKNSSLGEVQKRYFNVLILGGSQGALILNRAVSQAICEDEKWREGIFFFHQTGERDFARRKEEYQRVAADVECFPFHQNIRKYYEISHLIFSRGGSGVIAEVSAIGRPLVLVPLSRAAGGHQMQNAFKLSKKGCVEFIHEKDFNAQKFKTTILGLKENGDRRERLSRQIKKNHTPDGAFRIARWILNS